MMTFRTHTLPVATVVFAVCALLAGCEDSAAAGSTAALESAAGILEFDIAEDMSRFAFDDAPVHDDGMPAAGNAFVTRGYLYPHGHLDDHAGTTAEGAPALPEDVIGEWTCRGVFVGDGAHTKTGPIVITTQLFDVYDTPGYAEDKSSARHTLVTDGYEFIDLGVPVRRAITGGTGTYRSSAGEQEQFLLGFNESEGVNLRAVFDLD